MLGCSTRRTLPLHIEHKLVSLKQSNYYLDFIITQ